MFSGLLAKVVGTAAGGFLKSYGVWIIGGAVAAFLTFYVVSAERAKAQRVELKIENKQLVAEKIELIDTIEINRLALDECIEANAENALQATRQAQRVRAAQSEVTQMRREMKEHINRDRIASEELRGHDKECRTVDQFLPDWFTDGLRDST